VALQAVTCSFAKSQRFRFTDAGTIQAGNSTNYLTSSQTASGAAIFLQTSNNPFGVQRFHLAA